jgi:hypothetical protein
MALGMAKARKNPPGLTPKHLDLAIKRLQDLKKKGVLTGYDPKPVVKDGVYHLYAYANDPELAIASTVPLSIYLTTKLRAPLFIAVVRNRPANGDRCGAP